MIVTIYNFTHLLKNQKNNTMLSIPIKPFLVASSLIVSMSSAFAQDNLVNSLKINASEKSKELYKFTDVINVENTSIKNQ